jgi:ABC-type multidrug transport system fused ATPase/permease subunit
MLIIFGVMAFWSKIFIKREQKHGAEIGSIAEEVVNGIRTVISFNGQTKEEQRYNKALRLAEAAGNKKNLVIGVGIAGMFFLIFFAMGIAFYYGTKLVVNNEITPGTTFAVFWAFLVAMFSVAQASAQIPAIVAARTAAASIFAIIDRVRNHCNITYSCFRNLKLTPTQLKASNHPTHKVESNCRMFTLDIQQGLTWKC